ncbi:hypothetical protein EYF80_053848 [Liparis tanakae]|uniref:Uncharacterized protein n=1 Tax=Liparis tanakae TaxID=230148 RepID=A0A4Z2F4G7_9TELE|nr:hypothetical protein EYF80_053848 [Liparis tanakae]
MSSLKGGSVWTDRNYNDKNYRTTRTTTTRTTELQELQNYKNYNNYNYRTTTTGEPQNQEVSADTEEEPVGSLVTVQTSEDT